MPLFNAGCLIPTNIDKKLITRWDSERELFTTISLKTRYFGYISAAESVDVSSTSFT